MKDFVQFSSAISRVLFSSTSKFHIENASLCGKKLLEIFVRVIVFRKKTKSSKFECLQCSGLGVT